MTFLFARACFICFVATQALGCAAGAANPAASDDATKASGVAAQANATAGSGPTPRVPEPSVKPGINDPYFKSGALDTYTRILEAAIGLEKGMVVADIGAGTGLLTTGIAEWVGKRGTVFAVDIVPVFLERIRDRVRDAGLTNVIVVQGEEKATGLEPASLDLAFMCDTYHHIEYPEAYLASLFESLRPGAVLVLVDMKRPEHQSSAAVLRHVRADKPTVVSEFEEAGFVLDSEVDLLRENYYLRFRRP